MDPGGYNHPITINRKVQMGLRPLGDPIYVLQAFVEPFAKLEVRRGREHFDPSTKQRYSEDVYLFSCHYFDVVGIDASMQVLDEDGQEFDIKSIRPDLENKADVIIECTLQDGRLGAAALLGFVDEEISAGKVGVPYVGFSVKAAGGSAPYGFAVTSGALPAGMSLHPTTGAIAGTPSAAGSFSPVVTVTDAAGATHALPALPIQIAA